MYRSKFAKSSLLWVLLGVLTLGLVLSAFLTQKPIPQTNTLRSRSSLQNAQKSAPEKIETRDVALSHVALTSSAISSADKRTIKIGVILPLTGPVSEYGNSMRDGIDLAMNECNKNGGIGGSSVEIIVADDQADPLKSLRAAKNFIAKKEIVALIGALTSKCSMAILPSTNAAKLTLISPSSTNDSLNKSNGYFFRTCYSDSFQGQALAKFAAKNLKAAKAAILYDKLSTYSKDSALLFSSAFKKAGGTIVSQATYSTDDTNFSKQIKTVSSAKPDVIYLPDFYPAVAMIAKQLRLAGVTTTLIGPDGWDFIAQEAPEAVEGCYYSAHFSPDSATPTARSFVQAFKNQYGHEPDMLAALGYDAARVLIDAIKKAGATDPASLKAALLKTNGQYATGRIAFDKNGGAIKTVTILRIKSGQPVYFTTVDP